MYFAATCIAGIMDFFNFLVVYNHFGQKGDEYAEIVLMLLVLSYLGTNVYWLGYGITLQYKFPDYMSKYMVQVLFSAGKVVE